MSDFERRMLERAQDLRMNEAQEAAELEARRADQAAKAAEVERQALKMGMEVVVLLQKYDVPSVNVWELRPTGEKEPYIHNGLFGSRFVTEDIKEDYFYVGQGWQVYSVYYSGTMRDEPSQTSGSGISDTGRLIRDPYVKSAEKRNHDPVHGILNPTYENLGYAASHIQREEFQNGIASLISGKGIHRV